MIHFSRGYLCHVTLIQSDIVGNITPLLSNNTATAKITKCFFFIKVEKNNELL